jgi:TolA-binding protein
LDNNGRIVELLAESLLKQDQIIEELKESNKRLVNLESKSEKVEAQLIKLNLQTTENSRSVLRLADK